MLDPHGSHPDSVYHKACRWLVWSGIAKHPEILKALSPTYALDFFFSNFSIAFFALAAVVLARAAFEKSLRC